jgi:outer membrane receptor protein involved in Fe transport
LNFEEKQAPTLTVGYRHEWNPGSHTLILANRLVDEFKVLNTDSTALLFARDLGEITAVRPIDMRQKYSSEIKVYSGEIQQIWQGPVTATIVGGRYQAGDVRVKSLQTNPAILAGVFTNPPAAQRIETELERASFYFYQHWQMLPCLRLVAGVSYDLVTFPENFRLAPLSRGEETVDHVSPKAGLVWTPWANTTVRAAYTRSVAGTSVEQGFTIEPSQVAGFNQSYRSLIPESVAGANAGGRFETIGLSWEQRLPTRTYLGLQGDLLYSKVRRTVGAFELDLDVADEAFPAGLREALDYRERSITAYVNQLIGQDWALGARYRLTEAQLSQDYEDVPAAALIFPPFQPRNRLRSLLHQLTLDAIYNHRSGIFGRFQGVWTHQHNSGYSPPLPSDDFWQLNAIVGYRFAQRTAELSAGVLNLTGQDYQLSPLTPYNDPPRERTFIARFQFNF